MITAVDTNVLLDVLTGEARFGRSSENALATCAAEGSLVACDVVWAETIAWYESPTEMRAAMDRLGVEFAPASAEGAAAAGQAWRQYRAEGGARDRLLPEFLIAGHALTRADRLLTRDRGFFGRYFRDLVIVDATRG